MKISLSDTEVKHIVEHVLSALVQKEWVSGDVLSRLRGSPLDQHQIVSRVRSKIEELLNSRA